MSTSDGYLDTVDCKFYLTHHVLYLLHNIQFAVIISSAITHLRFAKCPILQLDTLQQNLATLLVNSNFLVKTKAQDVISVNITIWD